MTTDQHAERCGMTNPAVAAVTEQTAAIIITTKIAMLTEITARSLIHGVTDHDFDEAGARSQLGAMCNVLSECIDLLGRAPTPTGQLSGLDTDALKAIGGLIDTIADIGTELAFTTDVADNVRSRFATHADDLHVLDQQVGAAIVLAARSAGN